MKKFILIYGPPGIGKTTVGRELQEVLNNSMFLDVDNLWDINPFEVNNDNIQMVETNLEFMIENYSKNDSLDYLICVWVIQTKESFEFMKSISSMIDDRKFIRLTCEKEALKDRMISDNRPQINIDYSMYLQDKYIPLEDILVDTSNLTVKEIVSEIKEKI